MIKPYRRSEDAEDEGNVAHIYISGDPKRLVLLQRAWRILHDRRRRRDVFGKEMFREPAWEMLLLLYTRGDRLTVSSLARRIGAPLTTLLRWLKYLEEKGLVERLEHPGDLRAVHVTLTNKGFELLDMYLSETLNLG